MPLETINGKENQLKNSEYIVEEWILTADRGAVLEGQGNCRVQVDEHLLLVDDLLVSQDDALLHPVLELLADAAEDNVNNPLLGYFSLLLWYWKVLEAVLVALHELVDLLHLEGVVLRHVEVLDLVRLENCRGVRIQKDDLHFLAPEMRSFRK